MTIIEFRKKLDEQGDRITVREKDSTGKYGLTTFSNLSLAQKAEWTFFWYKKNDTSMLK